MYGVPNNESIRLNDRSRVYAAHLSLTGSHNWFVSWVAGSTWSHAIGLYSDLNNVYFFDPNYGVFVFDQEKQGTIALFVNTMWTDYGATGGRIADIVIGGRSIVRARYNAWSALAISSSG